VKDDNRDARLVDGDDTDDDFESNDPADGAFENRGVVVARTDERGCICCEKGGASRGELELNEDSLFLEKLEEEIGDVNAFANVCPFSVTPCMFLCGVSASIENGGFGGSILNVESPCVLASKVGEGVAALEIVPMIPESVETGA